MNERQMKKRLKKRIAKLQSDNDLMRRIIADSPKIQELYDMYNKPLNVIRTIMEFQEYKVSRIIPRDMEKVDYYLEYLKKKMASDLFDDIEENITYETYEIDTEHGLVSITASIFIGRK